MKMKQVFPIFCTGVAMVLISSCSAGQLFGPTITPIPTITNTPTPTSTSTPTPSATSTPIPTETPIVTYDDQNHFGEQLKPGSTIVFSTDFNNGVPPQFSGVTDRVNVQGYAGYGAGTDTFSGDFLQNSSIPPVPTILTLNDLPAHTSIDLHFLLAVIDSWDGSGPSTCCGPDTLTIEIDGQPILSAVFDNAWGNGSQTYFPPQAVVLARAVELGFRDIDDHDQDSAYDTNNDPKFSNIPHTSNTLTVEWYASGVNWQGGGDESFAIDNLVVILNTTNN
jgi:hypothetical protein